MANNDHNLHPISCKSEPTLKRYWERYPLVLQKLQQFESWYALDQVSDDLLFRIAAHVLGCMPDDRYAAINTILLHKLPIPVPKHRNALNSAIDSDSNQTE